ncbi:MAG: YceI family protein [Pseudomonadota bacterium]
MYTSATPAPAHRGLGGCALAALLVAGCVGTVDQGPSLDGAPVAKARQAPSSGAERFNVVPGESDVEIHVFRDGRLARLGHNHVIASTAVEGELWLAEPIEASVVELVIQKDSLVVDDPDRRLAAGGEFATEPTADAIAGTQENMLGPDLLDAARFPAITVRTVDLQGEWPDFTLQAQVVVGDIPRPLSLPLKVHRDGAKLVAQGDLTVSHEQLGLAPFSVMLGALRVREELHMYYSIVAAPSDG